MRRTLILGLFVALACAVPASAQTDITPVEPFKVGTFDIHFCFGAERTAGDASRAL